MISTDLKTERYVRNMGSLVPDCCISRLTQNETTNLCEAMAGNNVGLG